MGGISGALWRSDEGRGPDDEDVTVDALSWNPSAAYRVHHGADGARGRSCLRVVAPTPHATPRPEGHTRFVCVSDTHSLTDCLRVPPGDVLLHTGDFTRIGLPLEVSAFNDWLGRQPCQHKVVIAGNHELSFDADFVASLDDPWRYFGIPATAGRADVTIPRHVRSLLTNGVYLQDGETEVLGFRIYGSPWLRDHDRWANFVRERVHLQRELRTRQPTHHHRPAQPVMAPSCLRLNADGSGTISVFQRLILWGVVHHKRFL
ncbi:metallophosphoesterase MPPED2-like isoform X2 [Petromyzon marinus]|uniref:metallophosphoesterase MPPED2-like isoform X2 n=1 Tax=Petromyzon marinus TaxID=7757 RepID=UPI003F7311BF